MESSNLDEQNLLTQLQDVVVFFVKTFLPTESSQKDGASEERELIRKKFLPPPFGYRTPLGALRVAYLASISHENIREKRLLTKRDLYYMCRPLFNTPTTVDRALSCLSNCARVRRNDLNIVAAPKGLVAGPMSFTDEYNNYIDVGMFGIQGCLIPSRPERLRSIQTQATGILIVEKEASFSSLLQEERASECLGSFLTVTGKGYPDIGTCSFLRVVCNACRSTGSNIPVYILTDADPHGLCITNCYLQALEGYQVFWLGVRPSDNGSFFQIPETSLKLLTNRENSILQNKIEAWGHMSESQDYSAQSLLCETIALWKSKVKFEMDALSVDYGADRLSLLLRYVTIRIAQIGQEINRMAAPP